MKGLIKFPLTVDRVLSCGVLGRAKLSWGDALEDFSHMG